MPGGQSYQVGIPQKGLLHPAGAGTISGTRTVYTGTCPVGQVFDAGGNCVRKTQQSCPAGMVGSYPNCSPAPKTAAIGGAAKTLRPCAPGEKPSYGMGGSSCAPTAAAAGGGPAGGAALNFGGGMPSMPSMPAATPWQPSTVQRPGLTPIDPQAAYDPEIANQLARQRANTADLKAGTGYAEDVAVGAERDQTAAQMREAEQAAAQAGIPFDKAQFLMEAQRGQAARRAQSTLNREQQVGTAIGAESGVATAQAGERTDRLGIDLKRDVSENELALDRYGRDIQKYGIDAQAATAANNALMDFYGRLQSGVFSMIGQIGGGSSGGNYSSNYSFG